jgi:hypothetical protein
VSRMRTLALALLLAGPLLPCTGTHAQARGPSARDVREKGQDVGSSARDWTEYLDLLVSQTGIDRNVLESGLSWTPEDGFVLELGIMKYVLAKLGPPSPPPLDEASRASKNQEHQAWLAHMVGRFRLGGRVESKGMVRLGASGRPSNNEQYVYTTTGGDISGIADCAAVGKGVGVHCIMNATLPVVELDIANPWGRPPPSERVMLFRPAVLVFGINPDTAEIRASMVTDDSIAHTWAGRLEANTLIARRINNCVNPRNLPRPPAPPCFQPLEIVAKPDGTITMVHTMAGVTIRLNMQREPAARAEKPMKTKKSR